jgi:hypothetical protein
VPAPSLQIGNINIGVTTNFNSFATNGKNLSILKERKGFLAHPKWAKRFLERKRTSF